MALQYVRPDKYCLQTGHVLGQGGLQIGRFVLVNHIFLGQFVQHGSYLGQHFRCFRFVLLGAQILNGVTRCASLVFVQNPLRFVGTDSFFG